MPTRCPNSAQIASKAHGFTLGRQERPGSVMVTESRGVAFCSRYCNGTFPEKPSRRDDGTSGLKTKKPCMSRPIRRYLGVGFDLGYEITEFSGLFEL